MEALLTQAFLTVAAVRRGHRRRAAAAGRPRRADLGEGRRAQHRHRGHDAVRRLFRLRRRLLYRLLLARLPRRRHRRHGGRGAAWRCSASASASTRSSSASPSPSAPRADGAAASLPVQPDLSAAVPTPAGSAACPCRACRLGDIPIIGRGLFGHNAVVYLAVILVIFWPGCSAPPMSASIWKRRATSRRRSMRPASASSRRAPVAVLATGFLAGVGGAYMANVGRRPVRAVHDRRRRLHRHRAGHAGARAGRSGCCWAPSCSASASP